MLRILASYRLMGAVLLRSREHPPVALAVTGGMRTDAPRTPLFLNMVNRLQLPEGARQRLVRLVFDQAAHRLHQTDRSAERARRLPSYRDQSFDRLCLLPSQEPADR